MTAATTRQVSYLRDLICQRPTWAIGHQLFVETIGDLSKADASRWIDRAKQAPKESTAPAPAPTEEPPVMIHYLADEDRILRVVRSGHSRLYCKELHISDDERSWGYVGKRDLHKLDKTTVMTLDVMRSLGKAAGFCIRCSADLSDAASIARGMGPVCIRKAHDELVAAGVEMASQQLNGFDYVEAAG